MLAALQPPWRVHDRLTVKLECLSLMYLWDIHLVDEICRAVGAAEIPDLTLYGCKLEDGGAVLVESVSVGRGPKGLHMTRRLFDSPERALSLLNALRGNKYLGRLELLRFDPPHRSFGDVTPQALAPALRENKGLTNLTLFECCMDNRFWSELMAALSTRPFLRMLKFEGIQDENRRVPSSSMKRDRTIAVADTLLVNKQVDEMPFDGYTFDRSNWDALVAPRVECNLYRKRFPALQKIQVPSIRAAIVAMALTHVASKQSSFLRTPTFFAATWTNV
jgi:hypothetical protein